MLSDREERPKSAIRVWPWSSGVVHVHKPSTHVLTPPKLGALREVACDNMISIGMGTDELTLRDLATIPLVMVPGGREPCSAQPPETIIRGLDTETVK